MTSLTGSNNVYYGKKSVVARYTKAVPSIVSGIRLGKDGKDPVPFTLLSDGETFDYEHEVVELYSKDELDLFLRYNATLINMGILIPYEKEAPLNRLVNTVSDARVAEIIAIRDEVELQKALFDFTSAVPLSKVLQKAIEVGMPRTLLDMIEFRYKQLNPTEQTIRT